MRGCGLQCVTTTGLYKTPLSSVENWDMKVCKELYTYSLEFKTCVCVRVIAGSPMYSVLDSGRSTQSENIAYECQGNETRLVDCEVRLTSTEASCYYPLIQCNSFTDHTESDGLDPSTTPAPINTESDGLDPSTTPSPTNISTDPSTTPSPSNIPTDMSDTDDGGDVSDAVFAGAGVLLAVIIAILVILVVVVFAVLHRNKHCR